jgi:hypothetical protein
MPLTIPVRTKSTVHFLGALAAAGAAATEHLKTIGNSSVTAGVVPEGLAAGGHVRSRLRSIRILSVQLLPWEVQLFHRAAGIGGAVLDTESFVGTWSFTGSGTPGDGSQATGDTFYYYYVDGLDVPYEDLDVTSQIHVRLINRHAATAKIAGASGAITIEFGLEPSTGRP